MKRFLAIALLASILAPASAFADTTVYMPKTPASPAEAAAYVQKLELAVKRECLRATGPLIGMAVYTYKACIEATSADVAKQDVTGLYARSESLPGVAVAAK
ncbi:MAG TPA: hypothetical protein VGO52_03515 [Hyphomonadaceae bacterium]|jgi:hypothetical protein|nr:hypothetical protein [Hyphomonadaceae bacterium]